VAFNRITVLETFAHFSLNISKTVKLADNCIWNERCLHSSVQVLFKTLFPHINIWGLGSKVGDTGRYAFSCMELRTYVLTFTVCW
jgi:hypothetical protein